MTPSTPIRTAVIGVGYLGRFHAQKYAQLPGSKLVAVVDSSPAAAQAVATELGVASAAHYEEILEQVDAVSIAVPTPMHYSVASACLRRAIHVLVEKPITTTVAEARELIALAAAQKCIL